MRTVILVLTYLAAVLAPLVLAALDGSPARSFRNEIATGLGLVAFAMILAKFALSGRFRIVSGGVGLDVTMRLHQVLARTALAFAVLHPFLYEWLPGPERPWDPAHELSLTTDFGALSTGIVAFLLLPSFVLLSISRDALRYRHERWRLLHGIGALLIVGMLFLHAVGAGRHSAEAPLYLLWALYVALAALTLAVVYVARPMAQALKPWRVTGVQKLTPKQWSLKIAPEGHKGIDYEAGQFVWLNVGHSPYSLCENPFSVASAPSAGPELEFLIKELGDFTATLGGITPGTRAYVDGPHGTLTVTGRVEPGIALIAGGIGLAPMLGILRELHLSGDARPNALVYSNRTAGQIAYPEEIENFAREVGTRVTCVVSEPGPDWTGETGMIDASLLGRVLRPDEFRTWLFVLCGPAAMLESVEDALIGLGAEPGRILSERFQYD